MSGVSQPASQPVFVCFLTFFFFVVVVLLPVRLALHPQDHPRGGERCRRCAVGAAERRGSAGRQIWTRGQRLGSRRKPGASAAARAAAAARAGAATADDLHVGASARRRRRRRRRLAAQQSQRCSTAHGASQVAAQPRRGFAFVKFGAHAQARAAMSASTALPARRSRSAWPFGRSAVMVS